MEKLLVIFMEKPAQNGGTFPKLFCYRQVNAGTEENPMWVDDVDPSTGKPKSVTVKLTDHFKKAHVYDEKAGTLDGMSFPLFFDVDMEATVEVETKSGKIQPVNECYLTIDRDKEGKAKLDKNGKRHPLCVVSVARNISEAPRRTITWDNLQEVR